MIQLVCKRDYCNPQQITKLRLRDEDFKSNFEHKNSICHSKFRVRKNFSAIDFSSLAQRQRKVEVTAAPKALRSCSSMKIISRCQDDNGKLWKLKSTMSGTYYDDSKSSGCVTATTNNRTTKALSNVTWSAFKLSSNKFSFNLTIDSFKGCGLECQQRCMLRKSNVQFPLYWSNCSTFATPA